MRYMSPSRKRGRASAAAAKFSIKPIVVILCAAIVIRLAYTTDALRHVTEAVSGWTSSEGFAVLAMRGAGAPETRDGGGWAAALLSSQSSVLGAMLSLVPGNKTDANTEPPGNQASITQPEPSAVPSVTPQPPAASVISPQRQGMSLSVGFWYSGPAGGTPPERQTGLTELQGQTAPVADPDQAVVDDRQIPVPKPGDPGAKRVLEVTLTPPDGVPSGTYISNKTKYTASAQDMLAQNFSLKASDSEKPQVLIIHTHGSESYLPDERDYYIPTDIQRTEDTRYNVVRLGDEMTKQLEGFGLNVLHDREFYDYPTYPGCYGRALTSIQNYMKEYPSIQVVIDIHRDAIEASDGSMYKAVSNTEKGTAAQMMIVVGSDGTGLTHPNWKKNLAFASGIDQTVLNTYPTLMRPISLRKERFNQHATTGSIILEVGTAANTLSEALLSIDLFCETAGAKIAGQLLGSQ